MNPALILALLAAGLVALLPLRALSRAGWPSSWVQASWVILAGLLFLAFRVPTTGRLLLPVVVVLLIAPFVLGPDRLARFAGRRRPRGSGVVIDVTPRPAEPSTTTANPATAEAAAGSSPAPSSPPPATSEPPAP